MQSLGMLGVLNLCLFDWQRWPSSSRDSWYCFGVTYLLVTGGNPGTLSLPTAGIFWGVMCRVCSGSSFDFAKASDGKFKKLSINGLTFCSQALIAVFYQPWSHMPQLDAFGICW